MICYKPNSTTYSVPTLICPPWINKYYILDLNEDKSLVKWLLEQNHQVYLISWINPDKSMMNTNYSDYINKGLISAIDYLSSTFHYKKFNFVGYCLGGTLLASCLAYLAVTNDLRVNSATFLTTLLDFRDAGDFSVLINGNTIDAIEKTMNNDGFFAAKYLNLTFSLLRANDMVWSFVINNYFLGQSPVAFDLLYWNADSTNLPAAMQSYYLRNMYLHNLLIKPNALEHNGIPLDLGKINCPVFFLSAQEDHIAPWQSTYNGAKNLNTNIEFCLATSGHVAGVINPPHKNKYSYKVNQNLPSDYNEWLKNTVNINGSWWPYWLKWLNKHSQNLTDAINYPVINHIELAPGSYVKIKS